MKSFINFGLVLSLILVKGNVLAQNGGGNSLSQQVASLQQQLGSLQTALSKLQAPVGAQQSTITALQTSNDELRSRLQYVSLAGSDMFITGANLHIVNGSGSTQGALNGLGNLIVGYNEFRGVGDDRSGSHNIVVGQQHNYSSIGGLVAGFGNTISGPYASVSGGSINTATGPAASVGGGTRNLASGAFSWVSGSQNTASGAACSVSGGSGNLASGNFASLWHEDQNHCSGQGQPPIPRRR